MPPIKVTEGWTVLYIHPSTKEKFIFLKKKVGYEHLTADAFLNDLMLEINQQWDKEQGVQ